MQTFGPIIENDTFSFRGGVVDRFRCCRDADRFRRLDNDVRFREIDRLVETPTWISEFLD